MAKKIFLILLLLLMRATMTAQAVSPVGVDKEFLLGRIDYKTSSAFVQVNSEHAAKPLYLNAEVYAAFIQMSAAAKKEGILLKIVSGTRNFEEQKAIWEKKWNNNLSLDTPQRAQKILEFSSMPGTSRHHWGTDIDINNVGSSYFNSARGKLEYEWLVKNAQQFGFYQVYTRQDAGRTGYAEEKWHWSYFPLANLYLHFYNELITYADITGFEGADLAAEMQMIEKFVNGICEKLPSLPKLVSVPAEESPVTGRINPK